MRLKTSLLSLFSLLILSTPLGAFAQATIDDAMLKEQTELRPTNDFRYKANATVRGEHVTLKTELRMPAPSRDVESLVRGGQWLPAKSETATRGATIGGVVFSGSSLTDNARRKNSERVEAVAANAAIPQLVDNATADDKPFQASEKEVQQPPIAYVGENPPEPGSPLGDGLLVLLTIAGLYLLVKKGIK